MKILITSSAFLLFAISSFGQKFMHSLGAGVNIDLQKVTNTNTILGSIQPSKNESFFHTSGDYFVRYNLSETETSSVSIGAPVSVGLGSVSDGLTDAAGLFFSTDISAGVFYNGGLKSTHANESNFGYFVGGGASYGHISIYYDKNTASINTYGPMVYSGIRFPIKNQVMSVGLLFRYGVDKSKIKTFGLKLMKDF